MGTRPESGPYDIKGGLELSEPYQLCMNNITSQDRLVLMDSKIIFRQIRPDDPQVRLIIQRGLELVSRVSSIL